MLKGYNYVDIHGQAVIVIVSRVTNKLYVIGNMYIQYVQIFECNIGYIAYRQISG